MAFLNSASVSTISTVSSGQSVASRLVQERMLTPTGGSMRNFDIVRASQSGSTQSCSSRDPCCFQMMYSSSEIPSSCWNTSFECCPKHGECVMLPRGVFSNIQGLRGMKCSPDSGWVTGTMNSHARYCSLRHSYIERKSNTGACVTPVFCNTVRT